MSSSGPQDRSRMPLTPPPAFHGPQPAGNPMHHAVAPSASPRFAQGSPGPSSNGVQIPGHLPYSHSVLYTTPYNTNPLSPAFSRASAHPPGPFRSFRPNLPQPSPVPPGIFDIQLAMPPPTSSASTQSAKQVAAAAFGSTAFASVVLPPMNIGRSWHKQVSMELRVLVILNAIKAAGFDHLSDFLVSVFTRKFSEHASVYQSISSFLRGETSEGTRPADVVEAIWTHTKSQRYTNRNPQLPTFPSLPRYAFPPSRRLLPNPSNFVKIAFF